MPIKQKKDRPPVCDYEGSNYQQSFWDEGGRAYEDQTEKIAIRRLLPADGELLLEVGAGAGRNTPRYKNFEKIVLLDFSGTQLEQAQAALGPSDRFIFVAADVYRLPFVEGLFDAATMIRTLHHMADAPRAIKEIELVLKPKAFFLLEFANKLNLKAILRFWLGRQKWSPFSLEPVEFMELNFDFHPKAIRKWLINLNFSVHRILTVSHFRVGWLKRNVPTGFLVWMDSIFQYTGALWQFTPSVFVASRARNDKNHAKVGSFFKCPECHQALPMATDNKILCPGCGLIWQVENGIYNFKKALNS